MAQKTAETNRSNARSDATGAGQTSGSGRRRPTPEDDTQTGAGEGGTTAGQTTEAQAVFDPEKHSLIVVAPNPKRANSIAFGYYMNYGPVGQLTDIFKVRKGEHKHKDSPYADVRGKDLSFDSDPIRRHVLIGKDALAYDAIAKGDPFGKNRDAVAAFLRDEMKVPEKNLIKWGYMDKPEPAAPAATEQKTVENA